MNFQVDEERREIRNSIQRKKVEKRVRLIGGRWGRIESEETKITMRKVWRK